MLLQREGSHERGFSKEDNYDYKGRNIAAFKQIFIEQYEFAVKNYF